MKIDDNLIDYLQDLTRIELSSEERENTKTGLEKMLKYVSTLTDAAAQDSDIYNIITETGLRDDVIQPSLARCDILQNAPCKTGEYFITGKIIE